MSEQAEAYARKKPKPIIHNQLVIQLLIVLSMAVPMPLAGAMCWLVFGIAPKIVIPSILAVLTVGSVSHIVIQLYIKRQNKKSYVA